ncbi:hypothetical protein I308_106706 [Cryptococcus tetragattii IND107]|uniref:Uncharacterized protein n=1 Tax=Cryptococcus tetragattii IND107 TaxID=1296105 RepID=A0ABR3BLY6_9TREE
MSLTKVAVAGVINLPDSPSNGSIPPVSLTKTHKTTYSMSGLPASNVEIATTVSIEQDRGTGLEEKGILRQVGERTKRIERLLLASGLLSNDALEKAHGRLLGDILRDTSSSAHHRHSDPPICPLAVIAYLDPGFQPILSMFGFRLGRKHGQSPRWEQDSFRDTINCRACHCETLYYALIFSSICMIIRTIYRVIEYAGGSEGPVAENEACFYILDTIPMLFLVGICHLATQMYRGTERHYQSAPYDYDRHEINESLALDDVR